MPVLVAGRAIQGLGAGVVNAVAYVAISRGYPDGCRPRMFAVLSTAWVVPGLIGPAVAVLVANAFGWRWVFLGLLPLVAVAGLVAALALGRLPPPAPTSAKDHRVPYLPVLGVVAGAGIALSAITSAIPVVSAFGVMAGGGLLVVSLRRLTPPGTLTARRGLPATILAQGLLTCSFFAGDTYVPYAIEAVRHSPATLAALALTASTLTWTAGSWVQARYVASVGPRRLVRVGVAVVLCGFAVTGVALVPAVSPVIVVVGWAVAGLGIGISYSPLSVTTLDRAPAGREGSVTASLQLCDVLGQALGTGIAGALLAAMAPMIGHRAGVALTFAFGAALGSTVLFLGKRLPDRLLGSQRPATI
jgi:MFS family permease